MIYLHVGSGSREMQLLGPHQSTEEWLKTRQNIIRLLKARKRSGSVLLDRLPWELLDGTNIFGDKFCVLYARLPIDRYVEAAEHEKNDAAKKAAKSIVNALGEFGISVRFVAFEPDLHSRPSNVSPPSIDTSAASTARALNDAEQLLQTNGAVSAVDRVHTALHGFLRELCVKAGIDPGTSESITAVWKRLRSKHRAFSTASVHGEQVLRTVSGVSTILDALNAVRNNASLAHPNDALLNEAEAMLAVNAARTLLHYFDAVVR